jgi:hypothetical protein
MTKTIELNDADLSMLLGALITRADKVEQLITADSIVLGCDSLRDSYIAEAKAIDVMYKKLRE